MSIYALARPLLLSMDAEAAHGLTLRALKMGLAPCHKAETPLLAVNLWGRDFANPLGLAAGFDKGAEVIGPLFDMGFGFVETGTVTPLPQAGNPRPRVFRDAANKSVLNRMGFPGCGLEAFTRNVKTYRATAGRAGGVLGVNIGINKDTRQPLDDYRRCIAALAQDADYITVNVSSPNTAGLRDLQAREELDKLLAAVMDAREKTGHKKPLLLKVAPDLDEAQCAAIAELALHHGIDGLIVSNTTVTRPAQLKPSLKREKGGLSGQLLKPLATAKIAAFYKLLAGRLPIVGVGGIATAEDAYEKIRAGASLVQVYSGLVFEGPKLVPNVLTGLEALLKRDGYTHISHAVGVDAQVAAFRRTGAETPDNAA
ncbi:MAG: quinone-dependent dihydroorotate dehydrogenase [Micavibrio sp.]|nr:quinone-dependent dihydroorotate dehydrogenase [Micavibrio sp.]